MYERSIFGEGPGDQSEMRVGTCNLPSKAGKGQSFDCFFLFWFASEEPADRTAEDPCRRDAADECEVSNYTEAFFEYEWIFWMIYTNFCRINYE